MRNHRVLAFPGNLVDAEEAVGQQDDDCQGAGTRQAQLAVLAQVFAVQHVLGLAVQRRRNVEQGGAKVRITQR